MNRGYETAEVEELTAKDFTAKELQWIVGMVGVCSVCGLAGYLANAWVVLGLVPVAVMVWAMRDREPQKEMVIGPENDQVFLPINDKDRGYWNKNAGVSPEDVNL